MHAIAMRPKIGIFSCSLYEVHVVIFSVYYLTLVRFFVFITFCGNKKITLKITLISVPSTNLRLY